MTSDVEEIKNGHQLVTFGMPGGMGWSEIQSLLFHLSLNTALNNNLTLVFFSFLS